MRPGRLVAGLTAALVLTLAAARAEAYVGPGAGIALATTVATLLISAVVALYLLLSWPFRQLYRLLTRKRPPNAPRIERAIVIGLDGLDPDLTERFIAEGRMPALARLAAKGAYRKLGTTFPSMSPVAWSSFATGVHPGKHGIYDFLTRDPKTYLPDLSSAEVKPARRHLAIGPYRIPIGAPRLRLLRKSIPFWRILGRYRVPCAVIRVPITFPPDRFSGMMLSAMCVPDLRGTQGSYTCFTTAAPAGGPTEGSHVKVVVRDGRVSSELEGPENPIRPKQTLKVPFTVELAPAGATLSISGRTVELPIGRYTDWVPVEFALGLGLRMQGICRFRLIEASPDFRLYVSPINIDPAKPILPISHPRFFSVFLAKLIGRFATLGLAEDTWALNDRVLDEAAFLEQVDDIQEEREKMFFELLRRTKRGVLACVFDSTDRVQHMFMRHLDGGDARWANVIADLYAKMDRLVARVLDEVDIDDDRNLVLVLSDHGFKSFRRGVNLNSWLWQNGYLALKEGLSRSGEWLDGVDWSKTRAFALGLGGIFLNLRGRESQGIVDPDEARPLTDELVQKLSGLVDSDLKQVAVQEVYPAYRVYHGPYKDQAPDLIVGYAAGWRASWEGVRGVVNKVIFDENTKAWSGDHCIDPKLVPGVLFTSCPLGSAAAEPHLVDVAPTLLDLFGVPTPKHMDGRSLVSP